MNFAIAGGGTGGHLFPALAVGEVLRERGHAVLIFISEKEVDSLATKGRTEFRFEKLPGVGLPKLLSPAVLTFFKRFNASLAPCRKILADFQPHAVLGMGGFTSTPPILAGRFRKVPTFVHESNAIPGKANKLNAKLVTSVLLGFEECRPYFGKARCEFVGTPVRRSLLHKIPRAEALEALGLSPDLVTILVMGGSQGAHGINEAVAKALPALQGAPVQFIHLTGPQDEQVMVANYRRENIPAHVAPFCHKMENVYSAADLAIARSGAASLTELAHFGLPALLVPYPFAAEDHQTRNAEIFVKAGAAEMIPENAISGDSLGTAMKTLANDRAKLAAMTEKMTALAPGDAAGRVADLLEKYCV